MCYHKFFTFEISCRIIPSKVESCPPRFASLSRVVLLILIQVEGFDLSGLLGIFGISKDQRLLMKSLFGETLLTRIEKIVKIKKVM